MPVPLFKHTTLFRNITDSVVLNCIHNSLPDRDDECPINSSFLVCRVVSIIREKEQLSQTQFVMVFRAD